MRFYALASDYDGTLAHHGKVAPQTVDALERLVDTGRRLLLVTGRELPELLEVFPQIELFEWVVAENGALLYRPSNREEIPLIDPPPEEFIAALHARGVEPLSVGRGIVATWEPYQTAVLDAIQACGLDLQVIFNKGAVMILPSGVNKASGMRAALEQMNLTPHEVVGVGDAENDHSFLNLCECSVAVANALPALKERVTRVTQRDHGDGVTELIDQLIDNDLQEWTRGTGGLLLGHDPVGEEVLIPPHHANLLIAGPSGSGKSTTTTSLLERFVEQEYQFCVIDPEGDYDNLPFAIAVGTGDHGPSVQEVIQVLAQPDQNVVVNLIGMKLSERPGFFSKLMPQLLQLREQCGRPHWLVMDEAHHLWPPSWELAESFAAACDRTLFITVHPDQVHPMALKAVTHVIAVGKDPQATVKSFCEAVHDPLPDVPSAGPESDAVVLWSRGTTGETQQVQVVPGTVERHRHIRKYAEGELAPERSFYFRGPEGKLKLRAQNLILFLQLADGVDDDTWNYHLQRGDVSTWFRDCVKDETLAEETAAIEGQTNLSATESRERIRETVERHYTLPAMASRLADDKDVTASAETTPSQ